MDSEILLLLLLGGMRAMASSCEDRDRFFSFECHLNKKKKERKSSQQPIPGPSPFTALVPGAFPLHLFSQRCPHPCSIERVRILFLLYFAP